MANRVAFGLWALVACAALVAACSNDDGRNAAPRTSPTVAAALPVPTQPNYFAGPPDDSHSVVQRSVHIQLARPTLSAPFRDIPDGAPPEEELDHEPLRNPLAFVQAKAADPVVQTFTPAVTPLIMAIHSFLGQGDTLGGCVFPKPDAGEPPGCTTTGDPPDTNGAVGPNHFVQTVNGGVAVWDKAGNLLMTPKYLKTLWAGYSGTNTGNACATQNDGDPVVLYDQLADRWFITQFSLPNFGNGTGPAFQCVAVSQTGDPTGAYYLYDYEYNVEINDYGKFGIWPDAYYASFNNFNPNSQGANACAYDRVSMLAGKTAAQHCFQQSASVFGLLPSSVDGQIKPPNGEPGFFISLKNGTSLSLYKFHVDWATPAKSTFTGPTSIPVASYSQLCGGGSCITQPSPGNALASLGDRPMFHLSYRNFGTLESLVFNHSVTSGASGAPRWYEIRSPNGTPVVFQQGTYAPDASFRWMGSIAQDMAQDFALGYSISSSTTAPSIAWTGRVASDGAGTMGQAEVVVQNGVGVETGTFSKGQTASRWGDYSNMSVDPVDDCTFWYTQERYPSNGAFNWDTGIMSGKFANCGANDFSISLTPASDTVGQTGTTTATFTVTTASTKGAAETIALTAQDVPSGVTSAFVPTSVTAGSSALLTLTATATTPLTASPETFMVIGKAASAVHAATAQLSVVTCKKLTTCPSPDNCGSIADGCGGTVSCGTCTLPQTCGGGGTASVCGCTPTKMCPAGANCGSVDNGCGVMVSCGAACATNQTCVANVCANIPPDLSMPADLATASAPDLATASGGDLAMASDGDLATGDNGDLATGGGGGGGTIGGGGNGGGGGSGGKGGCGCVVGGARGDGEGPSGALVVALVLGGALARRRARRLRAPAPFVSAI